MSVLTLAEAKAHLNLGAATTNDAEVQTFIDRAEGIVTQRCGPLTSTAQTARLTASSRGLALPVYPVVSLTSVTPVGGSALDVGDLHATPRGLVEWADGGDFPAGRYDVVWNAGHGANAAAVPADLKLGVLELVRHLWDTQRGGGAARIGSMRSDSTANTVPGAAWIFPFRVEQLLEPFYLAGF